MRQDSQNEHGAQGHGRQVPSSHRTRFSTNDKAKQLVFLSSEVSAVDEL